MCLEKNKNMLFQSNENESVLVYEHIFLLVFSLLLLLFNELKWNRFKTWVDGNEWIVDICFEFSSIFTQRFLYCVFAFCFCLVFFEKETFVTVVYRIKTLYFCFYVVSIFSPVFFACFCDIIDDFIIGFLFHLSFACESFSFWNCYFFWSV